MIESFLVKQLKRLCQLFISKHLLNNRMKSAEIGIEAIEIHELPLEQVDEVPVEVRDMIKSKLGPNETLLIRASGAIRFRSECEAG